MEEGKNHFIFGCEKCEKNIAKDLENFLLLLRKHVMCYGYIDSLEKSGDKSLPPKRKIFFKLT